MSEGGGEGHRVAAAPLRGFAPYRSAGPSTSSPIASSVSITPPLAIRGRSRTIATALPGALRASVISPAWASTFRRQTGGLDVHRQPGLELPEERRGVLGLQPPLAQSDWNHGCTPIHTDGGPTSHLCESVCIRG